MGKTLLDAFNDTFSRQINQAKTYQDAYEKASQQFEKEHGFTAFESYDSFRKKKSRRRR
jgi:hypothetical protein